MKHEEIFQYYDDLMRIATAKCDSRADAEDLVGETLLAAFAYMHRGGCIQHPKTWLIKTLFHKYNDALRKKYRAPLVVCLNEDMDLSDDANEEYFTSEEAARVRREINHLSYITREVLIRFYFGNQSVAEIAEGLGIPEGTVKSRLSAGRNQMKKGLETMEMKENYLPGELYLSFGGSEGLRGEPTSLIEGDLIAQNLLILAYEKPITVSDLSKAIGIPAAYIEPIVKKLVDSEMMKQTDSGRVYTDFLITKPQTALESFRLQLDFAHKHFETVWGVIDEMSRKIAQLPFVQSMGRAERTRLDRYAVLKALQDFQYYGTGRIPTPNFEKRKDGGRWIAHGLAFDAGYHTKAYWESAEYMIHGGHRTTQALVEEGTRLVRLYEFDTTLWDNPHRFGFDYALYFKYIIPFLWCIYADIPLSESGEIPDALLSHLPTLEQVGLIGNIHHKPCVAIPVLTKAEYGDLCALVKDATEALKLAVGEAFATFIASMKTPIPKHLTSVPTLFRYMDATKYFVMATVREAYDRGLHLQGIDACCPPVVLVWEACEAPAL